MVNFKIFNNRVKIFDGWQIKKKNFADELINIYVLHPDCELFKTRTFLSMKLEWATHNFLYNLNILIKSTKDVDLNFNLPWYEKIGYTIFGSLFWIFIK